MVLYLQLLPLLSQTPALHTRLPHAQRATLRVHFDNAQRAGAATLRARVGVDARVPDRDAREPAVQQAILAAGAHSRAPRPQSGYTRDQISLGPLKLPALDRVARQLALLGDVRLELRLEC